MSLSQSNFLHKRNCNGLSFVFQMMLVLVTYKFCFENNLSRKKYNINYKKKNDGNNNINNAQKIKKFSDLLFTSKKMNAPISMYRKQTEKHSYTRTKKNIKKLFIDSFDILIGNVFIYCFLKLREKPSFELIISILMLGNCLIHKQKMLIFFLKLCSFEFCSQIFASFEKILAIFEVHLIFCLIYDLAHIKQQLN